MTEKQSHGANGAPQTLQDWPTLVGRAVDDVTRILQSEAHMLETNMSVALQTRLATAIATLTVVAVMLSGGVCILCAAILLLHQWLPLWQSFGLVGAAIIERNGLGPWQVPVVMMSCRALGRGVLDALLAKYQDEGVLNLDDANVLKIAPFSTMGSVVQLINAFGGKHGFEQAVHDLQDALYQEIA